MFYDNLQSACKNIGTTPTAIAKELKISSSNVTNWKNGTSPVGSIIIRLSELLNVSCDYLLTGKEKSINLTKDEQQLIKYYRECSDKGKDHIMQTADMVKDKYKKADTISGMENIVG